MKSKRWILLAVLLALLAAPACSLVGWLEDQGLLVDQSAQNAPTELPGRVLPTLYPTVTPRSSIATDEPSTEAPPATAQPITIAPTEDASFRLELTEADLAAAVGEGGLAQQGLRVNDVAVTVTEQHVIATFNAAHADTGLSGEITMVAVPQVVNGELYLRIVDYSLGSGFSGFARLIASALIKAAIDSYNTANGIPIPIGGGAEVTSVEMFPGKLVVNGVYR
jgi:hypothetical protein